MNKKSRLWTAYIFILLGFFLTASLVQKGEIKGENERGPVEKSDFTNDNQNMERQSIIQDQQPLSAGNLYEQSTGKDLSINLSTNRTVNLVDNSTKNNGYSFTNEEDNWNISSTHVQLGDIKAFKEHVSFEREFDGSIEFQFDNGEDHKFAMSFTIPNDCYIENSSVFLQYWGGESWFSNKDSIFDIKIYNSTENSGMLIPDVDLTDGNDNTNFDLTDANATLPAQWYVAQYSDLLLDKDLTTNNTFFVVFDATEFPDHQDGAYMYYGLESSSDKYETLLLEKPYGQGYSEREGKNGLFRIGLSPISQTPTADQMNMTVFNSPLTSTGLYHDNQFRIPTEGEFSIPIETKWFGDVVYNATVETIMHHQTRTTNTYKYHEEEDKILWNSSSLINQFPNSVLHNDLRIYCEKAADWVYNSTQKDINFFDDANISVSPHQIQIKNAGNGVWSIHYNQTNTITSTPIYYSSDLDTWYSYQESVNYTDFINVSVNADQTSGEGVMVVKTNGQIDFYQEKQSSSFPIDFNSWSVIENTSATINNSMVNIILKINNGTSVGFRNLTIQAHFTPMESVLERQTNQVEFGSLAGYNFSLQDLIDQEMLDLDDVQLYINISGRTELIRYVDYNYISGERGEYNFTLYTQEFISLDGIYQVNFSFQKHGYATNVFSAELNITFGEYKNFIVDYEIPQTLYPNDTSKSFTLNITDTEGPINDAEISIKFGKNELEYYPQGNGKFRVTLNSSKMNIGDEYSLNLTLEKPQYNTYQETSAPIEIIKYPGEILIPEEYQELQFFQGEPIELLVIAKNSFLDNDLLNARIVMGIEGEDELSELFVKIIGDSGLYQGSIKSEGLGPGTYQLIIQMNDTNIKSVAKNHEISIIEKEPPSIELETSLKPKYDEGVSTEFEVFLTYHQEPLEKRQITAIIDYYSGGNKVESEEIVVLTDENGKADINIKIKGYDNFQIKVDFEGSSEIAAHRYESDRINIRSKTQQTLETLTPVFITVGSLIAIFAGYKVRNTLRKKRLEDRAEDKAHELLDIFKIDYLLAIHKTSGVALWKENVRGMKVDEMLISGFMQAIMSFMGDLKKSEDQIKEEAMVIDYMDYKLMVQDGQYSRIILILNSEPSSYLKEEIKEFSRRFEERYSEDLKSFKGKIEAFRNYGDLINEIFNFRLLQQYACSFSNPEEKLNSIERKIHKFIVEYQKIKDIDYFYISQLLPALIDYFDDISKNLVVATLLDLIDKGYLNQIEYIKDFESEKEIENNNECESDGWD